MCSTYCAFNTNIIKIITIFNNKIIFDGNTAKELNLKWYQSNSLIFQ